MLGIEPQRAACLLVQLACGEFRDDVGPLRYSPLGDAEKLSGRRYALVIDMLALIASFEESKDFGLVHGPGWYSMLNLGANYAPPLVNYAPPMQTMGDRIKLLREARGLSQERLADLVGVTKGAVSQWESGGTENIKLVNFMKLCGELLTDPHFLIFGSSRAPEPAGNPGDPGQSRRKP